MKKYNLGTFKISSQFFEDYSEGLDHVSDILKLASFVPTLVAHDFAKQKFIYVGFSPLFREVQEGEKHQHII